MTIVRFLPRPFGIALVEWHGDLAELNLRMGGTTSVVLPDGSVDLFNDGSSIATIGDYIFTPAGFVMTGAQLSLGYQPVPSGVPTYAFAEDIPVPQVLARRVKLVDVPALLLGAAATITVAWDTPMPSLDYSVSITPQGASTLVGALEWTLVSGSVTASGCQIRVKAQLLGLSLGQLKLSVRADSN